MNKKLINITSVIFIFLVGFIIHNLYEWFPSIFTIIIAPVSESIFEHIKMIFTSFLLWSIIKFFILRKNNIHENTYILKELITVIFEIILFLSIFIPIYKNFGENLMITLLIYFITITISQILNYFIKIKNDYKILNIISIIVIVVIYIFMTYLSYKPPISDFFLDPSNNSYGLNK